MCCGKTNDLHSHAGNEPAPADFCRAVRHCAMDHCYKIPPWVGEFSLASLDLTHDLANDPGYFRLGLPTV
jgi:hypothetical protein